MKNGRAMKRAIITGATGAIGMALIHNFIADGIEVLVFCRSNSKRRTRIPEHPLISVQDCSLAQLSGVENTTGKQYDVFYHFAWDGTTGNARNDMYLQNRNVTFALDAVGAASRFGCHTFIGAGSQAEYGRVEGKLTAKLPAFPENGYGMGKLIAGMMTREHARQLGMKHIWTRILSVYGPYDGETSMVMSTIKKLMAGEVPQFTKGEQMWDYLYSGDAAAAFRLLGEKGIDAKTYVIGNGEARPLAEYILDIRDVVAPESKIALGAIPYSEKQVMHLQADIEELTNDVGWKPAMPFREGIHHIISQGI